MFNIIIKNKKKIIKRREKRVKKKQTVDRKALLTNLIDTLQAMQYIKIK
jgi:hypothetical protein